MLENLLARRWPDNVRLFDIATFIWSDEVLMLSPVEGRLIFIDDGHYSAEGIDHFARRMNREYQTLGGLFNSLSNQNQNP